MKLELKLQQGATFSIGSGSKASETFLNSCYEENKSWDEKRLGDKFVHL